MNHLQEIIDENRDKMPDGLAKKLLEECKREMESRPKLYRVHYTHCRSYADAYLADGEPYANHRVICETKHVIAELKSHPSEDSPCFYDMNAFAKRHEITKNWVRPREFPWKLPYGYDETYIVHSISPFDKPKPSSKKRKKTGGGSGDEHEE